MEITIILLMVVFLLLGLITTINFLRHPLAGTRFITYNGWKFYLLSLILLIVIYLK